MRRTHTKPDVEHRTGVTGKRRNRLVIRALTVLLAVPLGVLVTAPSLTDPTEAGWVVKEFAGAPATAITIPKSVANTCGIASLLGIGTVVQIVWTPPSGYNLTQAEVHTGPPTSGATLTKLSGFTVDNSNTTFNPATRRYTTSIPVGLLNGVLSNRTEVQQAHRDEAVRLAVLPGIGHLQLRSPSGWCRELPATVIVSFSRVAAPLS